MFTETLTQALGIPVASLPPQNAAANTYTVGPVTMSRYKRLLAHVVVGALGTNANVQAYLQGCNTSNGTFANITNSSGTNTTVTVSSANTDVTLEVRGDQLPTNNQFVQLVVVVNTNACFVAGSIYGGEAAYKPASQFDFSNTNTTFLNRQVL